MSLVNICCATCFVEFGIPQKMKEEKMDDHTAFFCPSGHKNFYLSDSDEDKLKNKLKIAEENRHRLYNRLESEKASHRTTRGHLTRLKNKQAAA